MSAIYRSIQIVFFSGTGGTKRIADEFEHQLIKRKCIVEKVPLDYHKQYSTNQNVIHSIESIDLIILLFPVHAVDAPQPIYDWVNSIDQTNQKIVVISVSGGGEVWPNTGCREECHKALEDKGFKIIYDKMMVMPSNWTIKVNDHLAMWLIKVIPDKVNRILNDVFSEKYMRTNLKKDILCTYLSEFEKRNAHKFAQKLKIKNNCTGCGWCQRNCPMNNIEIDNQRPVFKDKCVMCFKCIYGCPSNAIKSKNFMVLKAGYNLDELEERMKNVKLEPIEKCAKGLLMIGIKRYLVEK